MKDIGKIWILYVKPSTEAWQLLTEQFIESVEKPAVIAGDFNCTPSDPNSFFKTLEQYDYIEKVKNPTHDGGRIIDHVKVKRMNRRSFQVALHSPYFTDHNALLLKKLNYES